MVMLCPSPTSGDALLHSWPGAVPDSVLCLALCKWCRNLTLLGAALEGSWDEGGGGEERGRAAHRHGYQHLH